MNDKVAIIILNYNNVSDICNCIDSICEFCNISQIKFIVVDNASKKDVSDEVNNYLEAKSSIDYTYVQLNENIGYARGNNEGIKLALQDNDVSEIMILNPDILFTEDIISPLRQFINDHTETGTISPLLKKTNGNIDTCCARRVLKPTDLMFTFSSIFKNKYQKANQQMRYLVTNPKLKDLPYFEIEQPSGSCMYFKKEVLKEIGGFDPNTFLYYEEAILYSKLHAIGKKNYILPSVSCIHVGGSTTNKTKTSYFLKKCNYDSLRYYMRKYTDSNIFEIMYVIISGRLLLSRMWLSKILHLREIIKKLYK